MNIRTLRTAIPVTPARGFTLIELMIALALGLIVLLAVTGVMGANRLNFRITESLSEMQEHTRIAFELIGRDARAARDTGCGPYAAGTVTNLGAGWWQTWAPVRGFSDTDVTGAATTGATSGNRVSGTEALQLQGTADGWPVRDDGTPGDGTLETLPAAAGGLNEGRVAVLCSLDYDLDPALVTIAGFTNPDLIAIDGTTEITNGQIAPYRAVTWYIGNNGRAADGGRSLYRKVLDNPAEEILPGVTNMQMQYRDTDGDFYTPGTVPDWDQIDAIELTLTLQSTNARVADAEAVASDPGVAGTDGRLLRRFTQLIALRNIP